MSLYASFNGTLGTTIDEIESILTHTTWRYRGPHEIKAVGKSGLLRGVQAQQQKTVSSIRAIAKAAQDIAQAANQSTQLINDAIGGHVLIRREPGGTNEILIMDHPDPDQAVKIWRWNMGGLGYSDNVTGADNPAREYTVAMTMDGAINADFVKTGKLIADVVQIGAGTTFATGYDPSEKETPDGAQQKAEAAETSAKQHAEAKAQAAENAAKAHAEAQAAAAKTYAETKADAAEQAAKNYATSQAQAAGDGAKSYASTLLQSLADGTYAGGTFIDGKSVISPTVVGLQGTFAELMAGNPFGARLELGEAAGEPFLEAYDSANDLRVKLLQDRLQFYTNDFCGGEIRARTFSFDDGTDDHVLYMWADTALSMSSGWDLNITSGHEITIAAIDESAPDKAALIMLETFGDLWSNIHLVASDNIVLDSGAAKIKGVMGLRDPAGSAGNQQIDFTGGYSLWRDDAGAGGNNTRLWLDTPHAGEVVVGPRSGSHWLGQLRIRALDTLIQTYTGRHIKIWGINDPYIEPNGDGYGYVGSASKRFKAMWANSFNQTSEERLKTNIAPADRVSCYDQVKALRFKTYNLINEMEEAEAGIKAEAEAKAECMEGVNGAEGMARSAEAPTTYLGVIADESPDIVCDPEKKNINLYSYISLIGAALQEAQARLEVLEDKLLERER